MTTAKIGNAPENRAATQNVVPLSLAKSWCEVENLRLFFLYVSLLFFLLPLRELQAQTLRFQKINSGTKTNIVAINAGIIDAQPYFLTDKIYQVKDDTAKRIDFPVPASINCFVPFNENEFWFSARLATNSTQLYHYKNGRLGSIEAPLSNGIYLIHFWENDKAFMAGGMENYFFTKGKFTRVSQPPDLNVFTKVFVKDTTHAWMLDAHGRMYLYKNGQYKRVFEDKFVKDFCFTNIEKGYIITNDEIYRVAEQQLTRVSKNSLLKNALNIVRLPNGHLLITGKSGLLLEHNGKELFQYKNIYTQDLTGVIATATGDIWISGNNGILLYSGKKNFRQRPEDRHGFSAHNLISYAISLDNEYGVAIVDFNGDKKPDIYTVRIHEQNRLYINEINSKITERFTEQVTKRNANGITNTTHDKTSEGLKLGITVVDVDNDNDQDIYLNYLIGSNNLLLNNGKGYFKNVTTQQKRACEGNSRSNASAFADVDLDGDLDLFVTNEDSSNRLYENDGTGHFTDITATSGLSSNKGGMCASFADINKDGLPDLCVSFWYPTNRLYVNESKEGNIYFREITAQTDIAKAPPAKSNGVTFADINNDGNIDLFIANRDMPNKLYLNDGEGLYKDATKEFFINEGYVSYGANFADFDLDGYLDLYLTNVGENILYKNEHGNFFTDVTSAYGAELSGYCTGSASGDMDGDGDPDLYVANFINGNSKLFENNTERKTFIKFRLHGVISNKDAIGAKVWLFRKGKPSSEPAVLAGYREINGGGGYASISDKEIIFGGDSAYQYFALIKFPSTKDTICISDVTVGKVFDIHELEGSRALFINIKRAFVLFFKNRENHPEFVKVFFILSILISYYRLQLKQEMAIKKMLQIILLCNFLLFIVINGLYLHQWPSTAYFTTPIMSISLLIISHLIISRYISTKVAAREKQQLREKLSRDLHDDLASTLGSISIYSQTMNAESTVTNSGHPINLPVKIASLSQNAVQSISDIIWMTSPKNDTIQSLISKLHNMMYEIFTDNKIKYTSKITIPDVPVHVEEELRNNVFLILKEGFHNIVKHSKASKVHFEVMGENNSYEILLKDNGMGISGSSANTEVSSGNGLLNMRNRAMESDINLKIISGSNEGTILQLKFKI